MTAYQDFRAVLLDLGAEPWHINRYWAAWSLLCGELVYGGDKRILDVGGQSAFTKWLERCGYSVESTYSDLRDGEPLLTGEQYDLVLCMEVLEHIKDTENADRAAWIGDGQRNLVRRMRLECKPGGRLFLTTPNACALRVFERLSKFGPPRQYDPHVREMSPLEVRTLLESEGWRVDRLWTVDCWDAGGMGEDRRYHWLNALGEAADQAAWLMRGDCTHVLASKVA